MKRRKGRQGRRTRTRRRRGGICLLSADEMPARSRALSLSRARRQNGGEERAWKLFLDRIWNFPRAAASAERGRSIFFCACFPFIWMHFGGFSSHVLFPPICLRTCPFSSSPPSAARRRGSVSPSTRLEGSPWKRQRVPFPSFSRTTADRTEA